MVMEAPPSPDSVGREFVRQYYTLLNKAPAHLHRFYNNNSSFLHGGLDPLNCETTPVIGQKQIHQKIQQLNFRDCHAKISQVDSQATLGNGVVVQVTGELSSAGSDMRRFTQTFVLAAQSPKKYYVHNDIFRYQDMIVSEEDCDAKNRSDEDEINPDHQSLSNMQPITQQQMSYYAPNAAPIQAPIPTVPPHHHVQPPHVMPPQPQPSPVPAVNGAIHPDEINVLPPAQVPLVTSTQQPPLPPMTTGLQSTLPQPQIAVQQPMPVVEERPQAPPVVEEGAGDGPTENIYNEEPVQEEPRELTPEPVISNEPKTYATLLKSGSSIGSHTTPLMNITSQSISPPPVQTRFERDVQQPQQSSQQGLSMGPRNNMNNRGPPLRGGNSGRAPRQDSRSGPGRQSLNEDDERRRSQGNNFNDNYQLFLGNLPHNATEDDLREIFSQFGHIMDLRIHSKQSKGGPPGTRVTPNYGFITYENQQGVSNCLDAKPIYFPNNDKSGTVLNVEEKKTKDRQYGTGRQGGDNNGGPRPRDRENGQRRAPNGGIRGGAPSGGPGNRPSNFNRGGGGGGGQQNRQNSNTYGNRR